MNWNFDMRAAPRGYHEQRTRKTKDGSQTYRHFVSVKIIASDGKVVTPSYWLPDQDRWVMFTKDSAPIAWMPWPDPAPVDRDPKSNEVGE